MKKILIILKIIYFNCVILAIPHASFASEWSGNVSVEGRYFPSDPAYSGQERTGGLSIRLEPEYKHKWDKENQQFTFKPFYRWDGNDKERTHADIRQLDYLIAKGDWEFQAGISRKFWGVTESSHLVDIINQTDNVEGNDSEDKLGQPMFRTSYLLENGAIDFFILPYFRERTFAGTTGRFRTELVVDTDAATYESADKEKHVDYAVRWSHAQDAIDVGLSYFDGTSRDPDFSIGTKNGSPVLVPHYPLIRQFGLDFQHTGEETIWKFETIHRRAKAKNYTAAITGFEHSLPVIIGSGAELSLLGEYHFDTRGESQFALLQNDLFVGARLVLNNEAGSELLGGAFYDLDNGSASLRLEGSRRMSGGLKLNVEAQVLTNVSVDDPLNAFAKDDYIQIELQKFF